jgi:hypothetical protein
MKIVVVLLSLILVSIILSPAFGLICAVAAALFFIPGVGSFVGGFALLAGSTYFFGKYGLIVIVIGYAFLYFYVEYEKKKIDREIYGEDPIQSKNEEMQDVQLKVSIIDEKHIEVGEQFYMLSNITLTHSPGIVEIFYMKRTLGQFEMTDADILNIETAIEAAKRKMET